MVHSIRYAVRTVRPRLVRVCRASTVRGKPGARCPVPPVHTAHRRLVFIGRLRAVVTCQHRAAQVEHHECDVENACVRVEALGVRVDVAQGGAHGDVPREVPVQCDEDPPRRPGVRHTRYAYTPHLWHSTQAGTPHTHGTPGVYEVSTVRLRLARVQRTSSGASVASYPAPQARTVRSATATPGAVCGCGSL